MSKKNIEKAANYSVVLIALLALVVSFWQVRLFQNHNKLTVKPYLDSHVFTNDSTLVVSFSNKGLGPAIIQKMTYEIDGKEYDTIYELLISKGEEKNMKSTFNYSPKSVLSSGESKLIVELRQPKWRGIKVKIIYESIYKEKDVIVFSF